MINVIGVNFLKHVLVTVLVILMAAQSAPVGACYACEIMHSEMMHSEMEKHADQPHDTLTVLHSQGSQNRHTSESASVLFVELSLPHHQNINTMDSEDRTPSTPCASQDYCDAFCASAFPTGLLPDPMITHAVLRQAMSARFDMRADDSFSDVSPHPPKLV